MSQKKDHSMQPIFTEKQDLFPTIHRMIHANILKEQRNLEKIGTELEKD